MSYTKLFSHIITSSVWSEDDQTRILWITMLALSNKHGEVMAAIPGLAKVSNLTIQAVEKGIERLSSPDKYSRTPDDEGRRIVAIDGGWHVINYAKHRKMASAEDQKQLNAARQRRWYARHKGKPNAEPNANITHDNAPITPHIDNAEAESREQSTKEKDKREKDPVTPVTQSNGQKRRRSAPVCDPSDEFLEFWEEYPRKVAQKAAWAAWSKANPPLEVVLETLGKYKKTEWRRAEKRFIPLPATWLNGERWDDEL